MKIYTVIHILHKNEKTTVKLMKIQIFYTQNRDRFIRFINSIHPTMYLLDVARHSLESTTVSACQSWTSWILIRVSEGSWVDLAKDAPNWCDEKTNQLKDVHRNLPSTWLIQPRPGNPFLWVPSLQVEAVQTARNKRGGFVQCRWQERFQGLHILPLPTGNKHISICWEDAEVVQSLYIRLWLLCYFHLDLNVCIYVYLYCRYTHLCTN